MSSAVIDSVIKGDDVRRRLPEVELIESEGLRDATIDAISRGMPDYFWEVEASASKRFHNTYGRLPCGLWIHTKMVFTAFERIQESYVKRDKLTPFERDCVRSAILLHDMFKRGMDGENSTVKNHDVLGATWLRQNTEVPEDVCGAVEGHNGPWYVGKEPENTIEELVHVSDMVASTSNITCGVYKPCSEITSKYPEIPRANL